MIKKVKGGWKVIGHKSKRNFGFYKTRKAAENRLRQIKFFGKRK